LKDQQARRDEEGVKDQQARREQQAQRETEREQQADKDAQAADATAEPPPRVARARARMMAQAAAERQSMRALISQALASLAADDAGASGAGPSAGGGGGAAGGTAGAGGAAGAAGGAAGAAGAAAGGAGARAPGGGSGEASGESGDPISHLTGSEIGESFGVGGLGLVGTGEGGGGEGTIGLGNIGTIGHGSGCGFGSGYGRCAGGLAGRHATAPTLSFMQPQIRGGLDKEIIRRVVRAHMNEIRFCYESRLQNAPHLEGRVLAHFMIAAHGLVVQSRAEASELADARVAGCVADAVRRWRFPAAAGGGISEVRYPFFFHPTP
jgi:hypothetical protein